MSSLRRTLGLPVLTVGLALSLTLGLAACSGFGSSSKPPLEGERISILELQRNIEPDSDALSAQGFVAPSAWRNELWPQAGGYPSHSMQHLALNEGELQRVWSASIGSGSSAKLPLIAQPIVVDDRVFTIDSRAQLSAFNAETGARLWQSSVKKPEERDPVIGGGLAFSRGVLYVTNGYSELVAVHPGTGKVLWRADLPAPARAAPTVMDERIFVTTLDNRLVTLSTDDGSFLWEYAGISESAGLVGAASPATSREIVVPAFSSGELYALRVENGAVAWSENLAAFRRIGGMAGISDIRGLPVIDKGLVIAISFGGRLVAINERTGERVWQREIGGAETPWVAGNHLFVLSSENALVALGRDNGVIRWVTQLQRYEDEDRRRGPLFWTGPVFAGGRLIVTGSGGRVLEVSPDNGNVMRQWSTGRTVRISPVVAGGTLYLLAEDGTLMAYR